MGRARAFAPVRFLSRKSSQVGQVPKALQQVVSNKVMKPEKDPGVVKGTKLRILKYPNPKVSTNVVTSAGCVLT